MVLFDPSIVQKPPGHIGHVEDFIIGQVENFFVGQVTNRFLGQMTNLYSVYYQQG